MQCLPVVHVTLVSVGILTIPRGQLPAIVANDVEGVRLHTTEVSLNGPVDDVHPATEQWSLVGHEMAFASPAVVPEETGNW